MAQRDGKPVAEVIREAVKRFLGRPAHERNAFSFGPSSTRGVERIYPRFSKSDWDMLDRISKKIDRHRTELVREAVAEYLRESASA